MPEGVAPAPDVTLAERLFGALDTATRKGAGILRDSYGDGEQAGHRIVRGAAEDLGLEVATDAALNLYMTLPGKNRGLPRIIVGSHLDSVDQAGNFDGAAGVLAGLAVVAGYRNAGIVPDRDVVVMAVRCEEVHWFDGPYTGASMAFGRLDPAQLDALRRSDTGRSLGDHIAACGGDVAAIRRGEAYLAPDRIAAFIELHIEQAPVLVENALPLGIVTGIRGYRRYSDALCTGDYGHSGALQRRYRRDAVLATAQLIETLHQEWQRHEREGRDLVFTVGRLHTDPANDGPTKVSGETRFSMDFRSTEADTLETTMAFLQRAAADTEDRFGVTFRLGARSDGQPVRFDRAIVERTGALARREGISFMEMASGAGHDAALFAQQGVPTAMVFVRNRNGSHNPREHMDMADFAEGVRLVSLMVHQGIPGVPPAR